MYELHVSRVYIHNCHRMTSRGVAVSGAVSLYMPRHSISPAPHLTATSTVDRRCHTVSAHTDTQPHTTTGWLVHTHKPENKYISTLMDCRKPSCTKLSWSWLPSVPGQRSPPHCHWGSVLPQHLASAPSWTAWRHLVAFLCMADCHPPGFYAFYRNTEKNRIKTHMQKKEKEERSSRIIQDMGKKKH